MTLDTLIAHLSALHAAEFCTHSYDVSLAVLELYDPDPESDWSIGLNVNEHEGDEELRTDLRWAVMGWLVDHLEARGLRREVHISLRTGMHGVEVHDLTQKASIYRSQDWHEAELEALLTACRAVAEDGR